MSPREKLIAIGVGVAVGLYALDSVVLTPLGDRLDAADKTINDSRLALAEGEGVQKNANTARRNWKRVTGVNVADNKDAAESQLYNRVRDWLSAARLPLTGIKPGRTDREKGFDKVTVTATATGNMEQISRFLYSVQTSDFPVRVNRIDLVTRKEGTDDVTLNIDLASIYGDITTQTLAAGGAR